jgi:hypothetical protein
VFPNSDEASVIDIVPESALAKSISPNDDASLAATAPESDEYRDGVFELDSVTLSAPESLLAFVTSPLICISDDSTTVTVAESEPDSDTLMVLSSAPAIVPESLEEKADSAKEDCSEIEIVPTSEAGNPARMPLDSVIVIVPVSELDTCISPNTCMSETSDTDIVPESDPERDVAIKDDSVTAMVPLSDTDETRSDAVVSDTVKLPVSELCNATDIDEDSVADTAPASDEAIGIGANDEASVTEIVPVSDADKVTSPNDDDSVTEIVPVSDDENALSANVEFSETEMLPESDELTTTETALDSETVGLALSDETTPTVPKEDDSVDETVPESDTENATVPNDEDSVAFTVPESEPETKASISILLDSDAESVPESLPVT